MRPLATGLATERDADNSRGLGWPLHCRLDGLHSARRGDDRVVSRIDERRGVIIVEAIAHGADVYRPR